MAVKLLNAKEELEVLPTPEELKRLVEYYPSYAWEHRNKLLYGYFEGKTAQQLRDAKLEAKGIDKSRLNPQSLGAHSRWVKYKVKRAIIRILYLRYRLDEGMTQRNANQKILYKYPSEKGKAKDGGQAAIRHSTSCQKLGDKP